MRRLRDGVAHLAGGSVGYIANRIKRLSGRPRRHHDAQAFHILFRKKQLAGAFGNHCNVFQLSRSAVPAGKMTGNRRDDFNAARPKRLDVLLHGGVFPHAGIHCGRNQNRRARRHHRRRQHVIRNAAGHFAHDVGRRGRNQKQIRAFGQRDVLDLPRLRAVKRIHRNGMTGERLKRQRRNKTTCVLRHHNKNVDAPLLQQAQQLACLINRNAPGHAEDNARFFHLT